MSDYFALFEEPHRPWLDPGGLKKKFLILSNEAHPDRVHQAGIEEKRSAQQRYADLNQAYNHLRKPKERLQHLLELETGAKPSQVQQIPPDLMQFCVEVGQLFKQADSLIEEKAKTSSPLLMVQLFETGQACTDKLNELQKEIAARQQELSAELQAIDARWIHQAKADPVARATMLRRLDQLCRLFGYYARWEEQSRERIVQLAM